MSEQATDTTPAEKPATAEKQELAASSSKGNPSAPGCLVLILLLVLLFFVLWPEQRAPSSTAAGPFVASVATATATFLPGTASPVPPTDTPIPPPGIATYNCQPGIGIGKAVDVVYEAVRMRHSPGYVEKDDNVDTKHYMQTGDKVVVKGGPQIRDGLCWWFIEHEGLQGWTADHSREGRLLLSSGQ
jgi:hypothetical protein